MPVCEKALPATRGVAGNHVSYVPVLVRVDFTSGQTLIQDLSGVGGRSVVLVGWTVPPGYEVPDGPDEQTSEGDHDELPSVRPHQCMPPPEYHIIANHLFVGPTLPWSACRNRARQGLGQHRRTVDSALPSALKLAKLQSAPTRRRRVSMVLRGDLV